MAVEGGSSRGREYLNSYRECEDKIVEWVQASTETDLDTIEGAYIIFDYRMTQMSTAHNIPSGITVKKLDSLAATLDQLLEHKRYCEARFRSSDERSHGIPFFRAILQDSTQVIRYSVV